MDTIEAMTANVINLKNALEWNQPKPDSIKGRMNAEIAKNTQNAAIFVMRIANKYSIRMLVRSLARRDVIVLKIIREIIKESVFQ
jgi:hypothetical protein